jgi:hypothetical protein
VSLAKLRDKTLPGLKVALRDRSKDEVIALLASALTVEPLLRTREVAVLVKRPARVVLEAANAGKMGDIFVFGPNSVAVSVTGVNEWLESFRVRKEKA